MKKIALSFVLFVSLIGASFAENFFAHRFFEIKVDVPVQVSNNLIGITDIFQEEAIIDLPQIADNVAFNGAAIKAGASPTLGIKLDIPRGLIFGIEFGVEADVGIGLSKQLFEFLGHGNVGMKENEFEIKTSNTYSDLFATATLTGGWNTKKTKLEVSGTIFSTIAHFDASNTGARVYINDQENKVGFDAKLDAKVYTISNMNEISDTQKLLNALKGNIGFDLSGKYKYDLFRFLSVGATARIPLVPSKLSTGYSVVYDISQEFDLDSMLGKESESSESSTETPKQEEEEGQSQEEGMFAFLGEPTLLDTPYSIHRPMKLGLSADFHPFGTLLSANGYLGIGFRHPFTDVINKVTTGGLEKTHFYVDYSVGGRLSLWNILSFTLSHSYMDEIFKNEFALAFNIRLVEVDAGVSFQSPSFTKSFTGAGLGAFVTVSVGF